MWLLKNTVLPLIFTQNSKKKTNKRNKKCEREIKIQNKLNRLCFVKSLKLEKEKMIRFDQPILSMLHICLNELYSCHFNHIESLGKHSIGSRHFRCFVWNQITVQ